jgi:hypothetical protein
MENSQDLESNLDNAVSNESVAEKMLSQSEVDRIVGREKVSAAAKARKEAEAEYQRQLESIKQTGMQQEQRNSEVPRGVDADALYQQVQERFNQEMQQKQLQEEMAQVANNYVAKMQLGHKAYEDFGDVTKDFDPTAFPQLVYLVSGIENAADIVYDLSKNPSKLVTLDTLAQRAPKQARAELLKLSRSIAENNAAQRDAQGQNVSAPLDHLQSSRVSGSNGKAGIKDLRNLDWLRG